MVYSPDILLTDRDAYVLIINRFYEEIRREIANKYSWYLDKILDKNFIKRLLLISRYRKAEEEEIREFVLYLRTHSLKAISNEFLDKYEKRKYPICFDHEKEMYYVYENGKRMFFSRKIRDYESANTYYKYICAEQDLKSPHRYLVDRFEIKEGDDVVDAGVAEGNFSLNIIDKVKKIYLFEPDADWLEALRYTFEPYKDKVVIVPKALSDFENEEYTKLDDVIPVNEQVDFIKMDIEGEEYHAILGGTRVIDQSPELKCAICTYHQELAYDILKNWFNQRGFYTEPSRGYMWFDTESDFFIFSLPLLIFQQTFHGYYTIIKLQSQDRRQ